VAARLVAELPADDKTIANAVPPVANGSNKGA